MLQRILSLVRIPSQHDKSSGWQDLGQANEGTPDVVRMIDSKPEHAIEQDTGEASSALDLVNSNCVANNVSFGLSPTLKLRVNVKRPDLGTSNR